jgi:uncharacterized protein YjbJ (UPF0337 family)
MKDSTKDEAAGTFHEVKGAIKSQVGKLTNDPDGFVEKISGKIQNKIGRVEKIIEKP